MLSVVGRPLRSLRVSGAFGKATVAMADALAKIPDVEIDPEGSFKYILVRVKVKDGDVNKDIVRGTKSAQYHSKLITVVCCRGAWSASVQLGATKTHMTCGLVAAAGADLTSYSVLLVHSAYVHKYCTDQADAMLANLDICLLQIRFKLLNVLVAYNCRLFHCPITKPNCMFWLMKWFEFFTDHIFEKVNPAMEALGMECKCLGGGKIEHNSQEKKLRVFGESTVSSFDWKGIKSWIQYQVLIFKCDLVNAFSFVFRRLVKQTILCLWRSWRAPSATMRSPGPTTQNRVKTCILFQMSAFIRSSITT